jgi:hypothetical protein
MNIKLNNKLIAAVFAILFLGGSAFAQSEMLLESAPSTLKIDGKLNEIADSLKNYDKTTKVYYTIFNDANNLYVLIKANGRSEQNKILAGGISVSVNPAGKKKEASTITFPLVDRNAMMAQMRNRGNVGGQERPSGQPSAGQGTNWEEMRKRVLSQLKEIKVSGLKDVNSETISIYNTYGIKTGINYNDKNHLIYELAIPLSAVSVNSKENVIAINIRLNGIEIPESGSSGGFGGGMPSGGGMGGGGFYGRPGTGGFGGADMAALFTPTEFWIKAKLAQ